MMRILARAFPVLPGNEGRVREVAAEVLAERRFEADEFYRRMGISRETWHLQQTDAGPMVIVCTEVRDLDEAARAYAASEHPFDAWFKQQVRRISGVDPNRQPAGPFTEQVFEWAEATEDPPSRR
jgi:hypothetical protein